VFPKSACAASAAGACDFSILLLRAMSPLLRSSLKVVLEASPRLPRRRFGSLANLGLMTSSNVLTPLPL